ncbi:hypothetical protein C9374_012693 [Naegleria lovaniensis]|uniref:Uncharacterized protein n=1 Tax=Naegleria lovaniensis TaxID=51637 RepID=A0AA88H3V6_NAELO|nr:uncharacterized protein C9374_012693 [Naegleria lovaniensis]KAG2392441.1 hypothetical protein C9374_012693 [Naegleria lovaniensis]
MLKDHHDAVVSFFSSSLSSSKKHTACEESAHSIMEKSGEANVNPEIIFNRRREEYYDLLRKGILLRMEENYVESFEYLKKVVELEPSNFEGYLEWSVCMSLSNRNIHAIRILYWGLHKCNFSYWFSESERDIERDYFHNLFIGLIYEINEQQHTSLEYYKEACRLVPNGFYALFSCGYSFGSLCLDKNSNLTSQEKERYIEESCKYFEKALERVHASPFHSKYHSYYICILCTNIAWVLRENNETSNDALNYYSKATEWYDRHLRSYFSRASLYGRRGEYENAVKDYTKCIEIKELQVPKWEGILVKLKSYVGSNVMNLLSLFTTRHAANDFRSKYCYHNEEVSSGFSQYDMKEYEKRLADIYEERGTLHLENHDVQAALFDFAAAKLINPCNACSHIFVNYIASSVLDQEESSEILLEYLKYLQEENVYDYELNFFDIASIFIHSSHVFEEMNDSTKAKEFKTKFECALNHSRIC